MASTGQSSPGSRQSSGKRRSHGRGGMRTKGNPLLHAARDGHSHDPLSSSGGMHESADSAGSLPLPLTSQPYTTGRPDVRAYLREVLHRRDDAGLRGTLGAPPSGRGAPPAPMVRANGNGHSAHSGVVLSTGEPGGVTVWTSGPCSLMEEVEVQARCVLGHCCSACHRSEFVL